MKYKGMTVNERLWASGEFERFEKAIKNRDFETLRTIIRIIELDESYINTLIEHYELDTSVNKIDSRNSITGSTGTLIFIINIILIILAVIADKFWGNLGLNDSHNIYFFLLSIIIFGLSVGGLFVGIKERKTTSKLIYLGLIGNLSLVLLFLLFFFYIAFTL